jgi:uncharacterized RDD family membrane protein YckC
MFFKRSEKRPVTRAQFPQRVGIKHPKNKQRTPHHAASLKATLVGEQKRQAVSSTSSSNIHRPLSPLQRIGLLVLSLKEASRAESSKPSVFSLLPPSIAPLNSPWQRPVVARDTFHRSGSAVPLPTSGALYKDVLRRRAVAAALDTLVVAMAVAFLSNLFGSIVLAKGFKGIVSLSFLVTILYSVLTIGGKNQATWGMQTLGLKAVNPMGGKPKTTSDVLHVILGFAGSLLAGVIVIDTLSALFRSDRRMIRDRMSDYVIVRERALWEWQVLQGLHTPDEER